MALLVFNISDFLQFSQKKSVVSRKINPPHFKRIISNLGTLDMGSSFDLFDQASHHDSPIIASPYTEHRNYLRNVMMKHGFRPNPREWWHYSFIDEPFPDTYFDFHVK
jgi:D-alanyl-D-alanine dipeptidase